MGLTRRYAAVALGGALNVGAVLLATLLIAASALSPGGVATVPLAAGGAETAAAVAVSVAALALLPCIWGSLRVSLAYHYFRGGSWRVRRVVLSLGVGCMFGASITVLGSYLPAALGPTGTAGLCANAFGEALPELALFAAIGIPAAAYAFAKAREAHSERLAPFQRFFAHPYAEGSTRRRRALRSLFSSRQARAL